MTDLDDIFGLLDGATGSGFDPFGDAIVNTPAATDDVDNSSQKRAMTIFLLVDTSGSMSGAKIGEVNQAIINTVPLLRDLQNDQKGVTIQIALMTFASSATWITPMPEPVDRFTYAKIENPRGGTNVGFVFDLLNEKLSRKEFLNVAGGHFQPLILLLTDGEPTDPNAWKPKLDRLKKGNKWFQASTKVAIAIGGEARTAKARELLLEFTGNPEMVIYPADVDQLSRLIQLISVHASQWNTSRNSQTGGGGRDSAAADGESVPPEPVIDTTNSTPDWLQDILNDTSGGAPSVDFPDPVGFN